MFVFVFWGGSRGCSACVLQRVVREGGGSGWNTRTPTRNKDCLEKQWQHIPGAAVAARPLRWSSRQSGLFHVQVPPASPPPPAAARAATSLLEGVLVLLLLPTEECCCC